MRERKTIQKWFAEGHYEKGTEQTYLGYMATFCGITGKNPDELAAVSAEEALNIQRQLAEVMKEELGLRSLSITQRITALHSFWRYNGVDITPEIKAYSGTPWLLAEKAHHGSG